MPDATLRQLARAVADGAPVDWEEVITACDAAEGGPLRQLQLLSAAARPVLGQRATELTEGMDRMARLLGPVLWIAALKCSLGVLGYAIGRGILAGEEIPSEMSLFNVLAFGGTAAALLYGGARDRRALHLGGFFLLTASSFSDRLLRGLETSWLVSLLRALPVEAFIGVFLWLFVWRFPETAAFGRAQRAARIMVRVAAWVGVLLVSANLALAASGPNGAPGIWLAFFDRKANFVGGYWLFVLLAAVPALPVALWKSRWARADERRRMALFVTGIGVGLGPIVLASFLGLPFSPLRDSLYEQRWPVGIVLYAFLLTVPVTTASAVLVHRVLDVRVLVRRVLRHALARYMITLSVAAPFVLLVYHVYLHRNETVSQALFARTPLALFAVGSVLLVLARERGGLLSALDRLFFRERQHPSTQLARLGEALRGAGGLREICSCLADEIRAAMHPDEVEVLLQAGTVFRPWVAGGRPLASNTAIVGLLPHATNPISVNLEAPRSLERLLPERECQWLADGGFRLLVPITAGDGTLLGIIALGERQSELAYSKEDGLLLRAMAAAAAVAIQPHLGRTAGEAVGATGSNDEPADECRACSSVMPAGSARCASCGGQVTSAALPHVVAGKLRVERRIGVGGMGVVYRALDLTLGRVVALKTLPRVSATNSARMRREARAMAAVTHPNLALIYGAESWRGTPILVVEHLGDGTLADRLRQGPLEPADAVAMARVVAEVLHRLHGVGILHRDVKPSNIGFLHGIAKLMDFGLARLVDEGEGSFAGVLEPAVAGTNEYAADGGPITRTPITWPTQLVGTPLYLSPEAARGEPADPSFDLWALALVLYEALAGVHPMSAADAGATFRRIHAGQVPDVRTYRPACPERLAEFLRRALARDPRERPATAAAFGAEITDVA